MTAVVTAPATLASAGVDRNEGQRLANEELSDRIYRDAEPTLVERIIQRVSEWLDWLGEQVGNVLPGGWLILGLLLSLLLALVVGLIVYARPSRRSQRHYAVFATDSPLTAADHRAAADEHAAAGAYAEAIRERVRAVTRDLEERAIITPRPGRTATELATEAATSLPERAETLHHAAALFNDVTYGDRPATADDERLIRDLDVQLRETRPVRNEGAAR